MLRFAMKLQQVTGPGDGQGARGHRLLHLQPAGLAQRGGRRAGALRHRAWTPSTCATASGAEHWPAALLATSTHDTKRSEDVRARLDVLSELPGRVAARGAALGASSTRRHKTRAGRRGPRPTRNDEYLLYQTLARRLAHGRAASRPGASRPSGDRIREYMLKAIARRRSTPAGSTRTPDYEEAMARFVDRVPRPERRAGPSSTRRASFKRRLERPGQVNALAQLLLKLASPGVPDIYQGSELWDCRWWTRTTAGRWTSQLPRAAARRAAAPRPPADRRALVPRAGGGHRTDGRIKLYVTRRALRLRQRHGPSCSAPAGYGRWSSTGHARGPRAGLRRGARRARRWSSAVPRLVTRALLERGARSGLRSTRAPAAAYRTSRGMALPERLHRAHVAAGARGRRRGAGPGRRCSRDFPVALLERTAE